jgi:hypothetical protein
MVKARTGTGSLQKSGGSGSALGPEPSSWQRRTDGRNRISLAAIRPARGPAEEHAAQCRYRRRRRQRWTVGRSVQWTWMSTWTWAGTRRPRQIARSRRNRSRAREAVRLPPCAARSPRSTAHGLQEAPLGRVPYARAACRTAAGCRAALLEAPPVLRALGRAGGLLQFVDLAGVAGKSGAGGLCCWYTRVGRRRSSRSSRSSRCGEGRRYGSSRYRSGAVIPVRRGLPCGQVAVRAS